VLRRALSSFSCCVSFLPPAVAFRRTALLFAIPCAFVAARLRCGRYSTAFSKLCWCGGSGSINMATLRPGGVCCCALAPSRAFVRGAWKQRCQDWFDRDVRRFLKQLIAPTLLRASSVTCPLCVRGRGTRALGTLAFLAGNLCGVHSLFSRYQRGWRRHRFNASRRGTDARAVRTYASHFLRRFRSPYSLSLLAATQHRLFAVAAVYLLLFFSSSVKVGCLCDRLWLLSLLRHALPSAPSVMR